MPEPAWYAVISSYRYSTDRLNDGNGNEIDSVTISVSLALGDTSDAEALSTEHWDYEFDSEDRFQRESVGHSFAKKF